MFSSRWRLIDAINNNDVTQVHKLLESGVNPNPTEKELKHKDLDPIRVPLFAALYCPSKTILQVLLDYNANPHVKMQQNFRIHEAMPYRHYKISALSHLLHMSMGSRICGLHANRLPPTSEGFFEMYILLREHMPLSKEDEIFLTETIAYYGNPQAILYQQWEDAQRQRQEIFNSIEVLDQPQRKRKL